MSGRSWAQITAASTPPTKPRTPGAGSVSLPKPSSPSVTPVKPALGSTSPASTPTPASKPGSASPSAGATAAADAAIPDPALQLTDFSALPVPTLYPRGFFNRGNTCFYNSALQMLLRVPPFAAFLFYVARRGTRKPLLNELAQVVSDLSRPGGPFTPLVAGDIVSVLGRVGEQQDAQEFAALLLSSLHEELLDRQPASTDGPGAAAAAASGDDDGGWQEVGRAGKSHVVVQRVSDFATSPISRIFGGALRGLMRRGTGPATASTTPFLWLPVDIDAYDDGEPLASALTQSLHGEQVEGGRLRGEIAQLPQVLLLHLKRFAFDSRTGTRKIGTRVAFGRELVVPGSLASGSAAERTYTLVSAVHHHGSTAHSGHYTCDVRQADGTWLCFDDDQVSALADPCAGSRPATVYLLAYVRGSLPGHGRGAKRS